MDELDEAMRKVVSTQQAAEDAIAELHAAIREKLENARHGDRAKIAERTGYTVQHIDRIRRGLTSGKAARGE